MQLGSKLQLMGSIPTTVGGPDDFRAKKKERKVLEEVAPFSSKFRQSMSGIW